LTSRMLDEAREAPAAVARLLAADRDGYASLGAELRERPPQSLLTIARGSSDHAAHYMAYLIMARLGRLVTSLPMSLITLYQSPLQCDGLVSFAFSQSGQSHDLVVPTRFFRDGGARTVAFVNDAASPLADAAQWTFQLVAGARVVATWQGDSALQRALDTLPSALERATQQHWQRAVDALVGADRLFVISRGPGLGIAMEAALKFKEVCGIQAEAFSGAEVRHGPMALVDEGYPLVVFAPRGPAHAGLVALAADMQRRGARVLLAAPAATPGSELPLVGTDAEDLDPIAAIQSFYPMVEALARARGLDPDAPRHLGKVTVTH
jgi:glucosamine--fructose-6-phosphate aminotransferase (isomerizing)